MLRDTYLNFGKTQFLTLSLFLLNLVTKLFFLYWNTAESSDSIVYMNYHFLSEPQYNPLYPLLIRFFSFLGPDNQAIGRFVSMLMASLCVYPLFHIAKTVYNQSVAIYSCVFFTFSPLIFCNSITVMSDTTYLFFFLAAFYYGIISFLHFLKRDIFLFLFISGLAIFVRAEAILFIPPLVVFFFMHSRKFGLAKTLCLFGISGVSWLAFFIFTLIKARITGGFGYFALYKWGVVTTDLSRFFNFFTGYIKTVPLAAVYPVFLLSIFGIVFTLTQRTEKEKRIWICLLFYVLFALLAFLPAHMSWSARFFLSGISLLLIASGNGLDQLRGVFRKNWIVMGILIFCLICSITLSAVTLIAEKDFFGDIRRSAEFIKKNLQEALVYSDECPKTAFWSEGNILVYDSKNLHPGQYIVLHSFYTDLDKTLSLLKQKYYLEFLFVSKAKAVSFANLFSVSPEPVDYQNNFKPKGPEYKSIILRLYQR